MGETVLRTLRIVNEKDLHARASAKFAETCEGFDAACEVRRGDAEASGDSIMGLLMLAASRGTEIEVEAKGPEAAPLMDALETLVADKFGEGM